jgi:hypothetical protein
MTTIQTLELSLYFAVQAALVVLFIRWVFSH